MSKNIQDTRVLVVDDDQDILELLAYNLKTAGYLVYTAINGTMALEKAREVNPELIILDIMMPEMNGVEVCEKLRQEPEFQNTVIAFLTARDEDFTQISAYDAGGDDFINKPIKPKVLLSRIKALLKRSTLPEKNTNVLEFGDLVIDKEKFQVYKNHEQVILVKKEFELLSLLTSKPGKVFNRQEILNQVWDSDVIVGDRTIDVHIRKLREKLGAEYILTLKGVGYKFNY